VHVGKQLCHYHPDKPPGRRGTAKPRSNRSWLGALQGRNMRGRAEMGGGDCCRKGSFQSHGSLARCAGAVSEGGPSDAVRQFTQDFTTLVHPDQLAAQPTPPASSSTAPPPTAAAPLTTSAAIAAKLPSSPPLPPPPQLAPSPPPPLAAGSSAGSASTVTGSAATAGLTPAIAAATSAAAAVAGAAAKKMLPLPPGAFAPV